MNIRLLEQRLSAWFHDEVKAIEPSPEWWSRAIVRAAQSERPRKHRLAILGSRKWVRRALVAVPVAAVVVAITIMQPWAATVPSFSEVLAKSLVAAGSLQSYRTELTLTQSGTSAGKVVVELAYSAPDRYYTRKTEGGTVEETIRIGDQAFYRTLKDGTVSDVASPDSSGLAPDMGKTFSLLNTLHELKPLGVQTVDGARCFGYRGNLYLPSGAAQTAEIWIGQDDDLPRMQTLGSEYSVRFFDFDKPISIAAPITPAGGLQQGWHVLQTEPKLSVNWSTSIGAPDQAHSTVKYDITVRNDGLQIAKDVRVTLKTFATDASEKPQILEVAPPGGIYPVVIPSWQSLTYRIEWEFDSENMTKLQIAQLIKQNVITITYHTESGKEITQALPAG